MEPRSLEEQQIYRFIEQGKYKMSLEHSMGTESQEMLPNLMN